MPGLLRVSWSSLIGEVTYQVLGITEYSVYLSKIDSAINKFLSSDKEFHNISYVELKTIDLIKRFPYLFVYLINFLNAFTFVEGVGRILFYSNDLSFTYLVNKKLQSYMFYYRNKQFGKSTIFQVTWRAIIDTIIENEVNWSLENMYIIRFKKISNQNIVGVEYIGIPKLQASIIIDDSARNAINTRVKIGKKIGDVWLLEDFLKNKPIYSTILRHTHYTIKENKKTYRKSLLYALAIDVGIRENISRNNGGLFRDDFFERYRGIVEVIKETHRRLEIQASNISKLFDSIEEKQKICYNLIAALRKENRIAFTNNLLKKFLEKSDRGEVNYLIKFVFDNITTNDSSWEDYALALVIGIWSYGGEHVE